MITRDEAEQIAAQVFGAPANDPDRGWELVEFDAGWLVLKRATRDLMGTASYVVERESGRVMRGVIDEAQQRRGGRPAEKLLLALDSTGTPPGSTAPAPQPAAASTGSSPADLRR